jgi:energy-coupling factor transport system ATP-binding protein
MPPSQTQDDQTSKPEMVPASSLSALAVDMEEVRFTYHGGTRRALDGVTLAQRQGEVIGIMGASGAGKSTLVKCLNHIIPGFEDGEFAGSVRILGNSIAGSQICDNAQLVGMVFQDFEAQLFSTNVAHEVAFAMEQLGINPDEINRRLTAALDAVGLRGFEQRDPTSLSGGEKQRLAIASVLALQPSVIVLDEPTTDLDPQGKTEVFELVRRLRGQGISLVIVEHEAEELRECDRLVILREGTIVANGSPAEILTAIDLLEDCGVHPPDTNQLLSRLGISAYAGNIKEAEEVIRKKLGNSKTPVSADGPAPAGSENERLVKNLDSSTPIVKIENLVHVYGERGRALDDVSLQIFPGEFLAIIGQNGSGKTTLVKHIVGLLKPTQGRVLLDGIDRAALRPAETANEIGFVFQNPDHQIFAATVFDEVAFGPRNAGLSAQDLEQRCAHALAAVGLEKERDRDPFLLGKGERQRLAVASVLALTPKLLILDEPTTGLDYREQSRMMDLICDLNRSGTAVVIITHSPSLVARFASRAVLMSKGRILFDGAVRQLFDQDELLASASFRAPEITILARSFGISALTVDEFVAQLEGGA